MKQAGKKYENTPADQYKRWTEEFASARKPLKKWQKEGRKVVRKFLDERGEDQNLGLMDTRLNLFYSNIVTLKAMLYGNVPKIEVSRTFTDANDDVARVAALMTSRLLQQDIEESGEDFSTALRSSLEDRLLPGLGTARVKYEIEEEEQTIPAVIHPETGEELAPEYAQSVIKDEWVEIIYVHWQDYLYSASRTHADIWWKAYRSYMDRDELAARFKDIGKEVPLESFGAASDKKYSGSADIGVEKQAEVWEIWSKKDKRVYWFVEGFPKILDSKEDPLELDGFFPDPMPMTANTTTSKYVPKSDYSMSQDLYAEVDRLQSRISLLTEACRCVGVYDKANEAVKRIFQEGVENELIPVDNWAMLGEKGGLKGVIDWVPIEAIVNTISVLSEQLAGKIQQVYEITGMSDILRGSSQPYEAAATSKAKVQFASIRVQALQDDFARFASDLQSLKMEIIQKHFQPQSILKQSNILSTPDAQMAMEAVQFLKQRDLAKWRIKIRPESLALADYAQLKADRVDYIQGVSLFMQSAAPLVEQDPDAVPLLLELLKWGLAGFKGSDEIEGVMDRGIKQFQEKAKQPKKEKPDPALMKVQAEMELSKQEHAQKMQQEMGRIENERLEFQQEMQLKRDEFEQKMQQDQLKFLQDQEQSREKFTLEMAKLRAELSAERQTANIKMEVADHAATLQMESKDSETGAD